MTKEYNFIVLAEYLPDGCDFNKSFDEIIKTWEGLNAGNMLQIYILHTLLKKYFKDTEYDVYYVCRNKRTYMDTRSKAPPGHTYHIKQVDILISKLQDSEIYIVGDSLRDYYKGTIPDKLHYIFCSGFDSKNDYKNTIGSTNCIRGDMYYIDLTLYLYKEIRDVISRGDEQETLDVDSSDYFNRDTIENKLKMFNVSNTITTSALHPLIFGFIHGTKNVITKQRKDGSQKLQDIIKGLTRDDQNEYTNSIYTKSYNVTDNTTTLSQTNTWDKNALEDYLVLAHNDIETLFESKFDFTK